MNFWERDNYNLQNNTYNAASSARGGANCGDGRIGCAGNSEAQMREKIEEYSSKSEDQLLSELASTVARMKNDGTFDAAAMENLYNTASPFLTSEQKQRMRAIIDMFKG